jgi:hypothetical protein
LKPDIDTWWGRPFKLAILTAAAIHVVALLTLSIPVSREYVGSIDEGDWFPIPSIVTQPRRTEPEPTGQFDDASPLRPETEIPQPAMSPEAPVTRTIPPTTLNALTEPTQPLIIKPAGIGRRTPPVDARRLAIARAESLVNSRLATLPGAGTPEPKRPIALAEDGGVAVVIPWPGFLPADRYDAVWRADRCRKTDRGDDDDKPGEAEARRAQC